MSRSFRRFFNWTEDISATEEFKKQIASRHVVAHEKFDGSLITVVYFDDAWHIFTRGSDADTNPYRGMQTVNASLAAGKSKEVLHTSEKPETFGSRVRSLLNLQTLHKNITYVFELCSTTANVTKYDSTFLALLSANIDGIEIYGSDLELLHKSLPKTVLRPETLYPTDVEDLYTHLKTKSPDFEGYVLSYASSEDGKTIHRMKLKQESYVILHHSRSKQITIVDAIRIIATNEVDEVLSYMPEYKTTFDDIKAKLTKISMYIDAFIAVNRHLSRRDFAVAIPKDAELKWLYFDLYQGKYLHATHGMYSDSNYGKVASVFSN